MRILLFVSLALNLAVAGLAIGAAIKGPPPEHRRPDRIGGPLTMALPPEARREMGRAMWQRMSEGRPDRARLGEEYRAIVEALRAPEWDSTQIEATFARQLAASTDRTRIGQELLLERIAAMSAGERSDFADRLEEEMRRGPRGPRGSGDRKDTRSDGGGDAAAE